MVIRNLLFLILFIKLIESSEYVTIKFEKSDCTGRALIIYSSTQCSPAGYYNVQKDGKTVSVTISNNIKKYSDCTAPQSNYDDELGKCTNGFKMFYNENSNVSIPDSYCSEVRILPDGDCSNALELVSYYNGVCNDGDDGTQYRYECNGNKVKRYKCKECKTQLIGCQFDKDLDSIDKCPTIKSKSLADITGDKSIPTPEPTKPNDNSTSTSGGNNNGTSTSGGNNNSNTGGATTGGATTGDNGNHSTILNINILFILFLSILLLLN